MEFAFDCQSLFEVDEDGIAVLFGKQVRDCAQPSQTRGFGSLQSPLKSSPAQQIASIIDRMGAASAAAQKLATVITTTAKFADTEQLIYLKVSGGRAEGFLKVGAKKLFHRDLGGRVHELNLQCVLDFYVHESLQRLGIGNLIFLKMLRHLAAKPNKLGYDRPSNKLLGFLSKNYDLKSYIPQNNNFVVYDAFWKVPRVLEGLRNTR